MASILVLTGVTGADQAAALDGDRKPDDVVSGPAEAWEWIRSRLAE
jgi:hypothetical protein